MHGINEEETEHLDPLGAQAFLLVEMLPNGPANHFPLNGESIHIAPGFSLLEVLLDAGHAEFDELAPLFDADLPNVAVTVDGAASCLFEVVAILDNLYLAPDASSLLDIKFDRGADCPSPVAR